MEKPVLAILAAGIGSRYGSLKQIDAVGANGELIMDYSIFDAVEAGFEKVVFIITHEIERGFKEVIGGRIGRHVETAYAYQELDSLPAGYVVPEGRKKPWGTTHAILSARDLIGGPFAVINADDYYGPTAFRTIYNWLSVPRREGGALHFAMVGYLIENTVPARGRVTRGICEVDKRGYLARIAERRMVEKTSTGARYSEDNGETWSGVPAGTLVSMNLWGLNDRFFAESELNFKEFLDNVLPSNPMTREYPVPEDIDSQLRRGRSDVEVLSCLDTWCGITYKEDKTTVTEAIVRKHQEGIYPTPLWKPVKPL
ncbi:MAG: hypothetical protein LBT08_02605 [Synergistaceae bacterium]|jgi:hypothetical protein|nr:hypothetical protein [Synergistaceae bacterium]